MKKFAAVLLAVLTVFGCMACLSSCGKEAKTAQVIDIALTDEVYAYAVKKGDADLLKQLNDFLKEIKDNGKFEEVMAKYFKDGTPDGVASAAKDASKDQLIVATNAAFAPFEYTEGDKFLGVDMEIMKMFADKLGKELVIDNMEFESVCESVGNGLCDVAAAGLTVNEERTKILDFSDSYYNASQKVIVLTGDDIFAKCKTVDDVEKIIKDMKQGTKIGCQKGTTGELYIKGDEDWGFDGFANIDCVSYSNGSLAVQDLLNGNIAAVIIDEAPATSIVESINALQ